MESQLPLFCVKIRGEANRLLQKAPGALVLDSIATIDMEEEKL